MMLHTHCIREKICGDKLLHAVKVSLRGESIAELANLIQDAQKSPNRHLAGDVFLLNSILNNICQKFFFQIFLDILFVSKNFLEKQNIFQKKNINFFFLKHLSRKDMRKKLEWNQILWKNFFQTKFFGGKIVKNPKKLFSKILFQKRKMVSKKKNFK